MSAVVPEHEMEITRRVLYMFDAVKQFPDIGEDMIMHGLTDGGNASKIEAKLAVRIVPIALSDLMLKELGQTTSTRSFQVMNEEGIWIDFDIDLVAYFRITKSLANAASQSQFTKYASLEALHNLSSRSPTMQGVYSYLRAGNDISNVKDLQWLPPMLWGISAEEVDEYLKNL
jgi:hypothetical protein